MSIEISIALSTLSALAIDGTIFEARPDDVVRPPADAMDEIVVIMCGELL